VNGSTVMGRQCTVLLVEDDDDTREALGEVLENAGYGVLVASNGAVALRLLRAEPEGDRSRCDVVVLDLMMPVMNGWDFRAKQRADPGLAQIPVLLMSAGGHLSIVSDELKVADYINKPIEVPDLLQKIARLRPE
jgi:CheY-like chemotaxis protein